MKLGDLILKLLRQELKFREGEFTALEAGRQGDPFRVLVATILSQNTNEKNTFLAFEKLDKGVGVTPFRILQAGEGKIKELIAVAGLQDQKAKAVVEVSKLIQERYGGDLKKLLALGEEVVRKELGSVRGVGDKTIDVLLAFSGFPVVPIDTHVKRVSRRLGLAHSSNYKKIREELHRVFRENVRLEAHLLLIKLGREICKARNPLCFKCPLKELCLNAFKVSTD
ncbi:MAG: endonuclease III [Thermofilaceae archaeon]